MKKILAMSLLLLAMCCGTNAQQSICGTSDEMGGQIQCTGCSQVVSYEMPVRQWHGPDLYDYVWVECCETEVYFVYRWVDYCGFAQYRKDQSLLEIARKEQLLLPDCSGRLLPADALLRDPRTLYPRHVRAF